MLTCDLHCIVKGGVLVEEPEDAVVGLGVDALLLELGDFLGLVCQQVQLEHLEEAVTVLGRELDGEVEVVLGVIELEVAVMGAVGH